MSKKISRRHFIASVGAGAMLPVIGRTVYAQSAPRAATNVRVGSNLLSPSDFTYLGHYDVATNGSNSVYAQGFTHRYVNGDLRFYSSQSNGRLDEISLTGYRYGDTIKSAVRSWPAIGGQKDFRGFWYEETKDRFWSVAATDYTTTVVPTQIYTRTLNDDGTVSNLHGPISLENINAKRVYGGIQPVPAWFQQQYGVGPYVVGWGGYTSLANQGGGCSIGPTMYAIPDPANYADNSTIPSGAFRTIMDYSGPSSHRGSRVTIPINYYDGGDPRQNPTSPPTNPPLSTAKWLSPAPDNTGFWVWGDSYWNTGVWIDGPRKQGFVAVASLGGGKTYYMHSTLNSDKQQYELHIFDPMRLGAAAHGQMGIANVRPTTMTELFFPGLGAGKVGNAPTKNIGGATYDPISKRLYMIGYWTDLTMNRIYVFQVDA